MNHTGATLVLVLAMLTQSCATWMFPYATLVPEALPPDVKGNITHSGRTKIKLEEMKLRVETRNSSPVHGFSWSWILFPVFSFPSPSYGDVKDTFHAPLIVYIDFSAEVEGYSFHPSEVSIEQGERGPTAPAGFTGPGRTRDERCEGPGHSDLPRFGTEGVSPIKPGGRTCFVLAFDTDLADEAPIRLAIHGLQKDGQEVAVPDLTLTKREARAFLGPRIWNPW